MIGAIEKRSGPASLILALAVASCGGGPSGGDDSSVFRLQFTPFDLTTGVAPDASLALENTNLGRSFNPTNVDAFVGAVSLRSWPEEASVEAAISWDDARVRLLPAAPLSEGWYELRLEPTLPAMMFEVRERWGIREMQIGARALFHVGSLPLMVASIEPV